MAVAEEEELESAEITAYPVPETDGEVPPKDTDKSGEAKNGGGSVVSLEFLPQEELRQLKGRGMSGDVVNLRQFRKRNARAEKEKQAEQNRISFGRTKAEKSLTDALNAKAAKALDQGRREPAADRPDEAED